MYRLAGKGGQHRTVFSGAVASPKRTDVVRRIYPAHGPVIDDAPAKIQEFIDHRLLREQQILDALGDGLATIPAIVARIYAEVPVALHPMAAMSVESHLKKLAKEARVRVAPEVGEPARWIRIV